MEMFKLIRSSCIGQACKSRISSSKETRNYESRENNSKDEETQYKSSIERPLYNSRTQYEKAVLKAYGILPLATEERNGFALSRKETKRKECSQSKGNSVMLHAEDQFSKMGPSQESQTANGQQERNSTQYEKMVLNAYGILPVHGCLSKF